jgi:hypothetical protein
MMVAFDVVQELKVEKRGFLKKVLRQDTDDITAPLYS